MKPGERCEHGILWPHECRDCFDVSNNPHLKASIQLARESGLELGREDFRSSNEHKPVKCGCGSTLWWKPTVGAYVCRGCYRVGLPAGRCAICAGTNCKNPHDGRD